MLKFLVLSVFLACAFGAQPGIYRSDLEPDLTRILKGEDANEGEYPYIVSLNFHKNRKHACGASVLTKDWALTAAHCCATCPTDISFVHEASSGKVNGPWMPENFLRARRTTAQNSRGGLEMYIHSNTIYLSGKGEEHEIEEYKIHKNYAPTDMWRNDICLIKVKTPFNFSRILQQVTLPPQGYRVGQGDSVTIVGWGYTEPNINNPQLPDRLQVGRNYKALDNNVCQREVTTKIHDEYLCVKPGKFGMGACNGDSGSPLTKNGVQVGIASWVFQPCGLGLPDIYTKLPLYIDWVKETLGPDASQLKFARY